MKVISHWLDTTPMKPGLVVTVSGVLRNNTKGSTPLARRTLRLLLDEFWKEKSEPELIGSQKIFLPGLKPDSLRRVQATLRKPYIYRNRTISREQGGVLVIGSPHAFLQRDLVVITLMTGVGKVRYSEKASRQRNALDIVLNGKRTVDAVLHEIDNYMK
jgi:hypothetical protein